MKGLEGKNIGIAGARRLEELSNLVRKSGGTPQAFPIQGELILNEETAEENVTHFLANEFDFISLTTGIGAEALEAAARKIGRFDLFLEKLTKEVLAIRGIKTVKWLRKHQLTASFTAEEGMMENLLNYFAEQRNRAGKSVFLQSYHQDEEMIRKRLLEYGYDVYVAQPYVYKQPDPVVLSNLKRSIKEQALDAVVLTTKMQVQNLFNDAEDNEALVQAFNEHVTACAVGKVTAKELENYGVEKVYYPENQRMGAMIIGLRDLLANEKEIKIN